MKDVLHAMLFTPLRSRAALILGADGKPMEAPPRWGLPMLFQSSPGAGKTDILNDLGSAYQFPVVCLSPGTHGEGAFGVTPVPQKVWEKDIERMILGYPPPEWVLALVNGGILFVDELTTAPPALQPPMLGMIQERMVGFYRFPNRVRVMGACNPVSLSAGGYALSAPVANRMGHYEWEPPTAVEWGQWLISHALGGYNGPTFDAQAEEDRVLSLWPNEWAHCAGLVAAFTARKGEGVLMQVPPDGDPRLSGAWASLRTWEFATRAWASARVHKLNDVQRDKMIAAFVGCGPRDELLSFVEKQDLPDAAEVLDGRLPWKHDRKRLDRTYAVLSACTSLVTSMKPSDAQRAPRAEKLWQVFAETREGGAVDAVQPYAQTVVLSGLGVGKAAEKVLAALRDDFRAAGIGDKGRAA